MSWSDLVRLLSRSWALILLLTVMLAGGAALTSVDPPSVYVSTSQLASANQARATTFAQFAKTDAVVVPAARAAGVDITSQELAGRISTQATASSAVFSVSVNADDPAEAQALGIAVTSALLEEIRSFEAASGVAIDPIRLLQPAGPAVLVSGGSTLGIRVAAASVIGLVGGLALAWLRFLVGFPVRDEKEAAAFSAAPVIGRIDDAQGAESVVDELGLHRDVRFLSAGGRRAYAVVDAVPERSSEGVALALAQALAKAGDRVALIGLEPEHCGLAERLGTTGSPGLSDVLAGLAPVEQASQHWEDSSLTVIPAGSRAPNATELLTLPAAHELIRRLEQDHHIILASGSLASVAGSEDLFDGSLLVATPRDTTDLELSRTAAELSVSSPVVAVIARQPGRRGLAAWWSRVRRRLAAGRRRQARSTGEHAQIEQAAELA